MDLKDKTAALVELVKLRLDKYKQTRELEFKVNIALWTLIVLIGYYYRDTFNLANKGDWVFFVVVTLVIVPGHFFLWLVPVSHSLARDNAKALELQKQIENIVNERSDVPDRDEKQIKKSYLGWNLFLAGITLLLLILLGVFFSI
jgi:small-conductance mechanosensitive channel